MVDCTGLENRQRETFREFESHRLRQQDNRLLRFAIVLLAENRRRQAHMDSAPNKLNGDGDRLRLACNAQRREDVTEQIKVILLAALMLPGEPAGPGRRAG